MDSGAEAGIRFKSVGCRVNCKEPSLQLQELRFIEYFAGKGRVSLCSRLSGRATASLDIEYYKPLLGEHNYMDILTDAGMASPVQYFRNKNEGHPKQDYVT